MKSVRSLKVAAAVQQQLSVVILRYYRQIPMHNINYVDMSPDLKNAKVYIYAYETQKIHKIIEKLQKQSKHITSYLFKSMSLKYPVNLTFLRDGQMDKVLDLDNLLSKKD